MKATLYRCNLCNSAGSIHGEPAEKMLGILFGETWIGPKDSRTRQATIIWKPPAGVEHHLCHDCYNAIRRAPLAEGEGLL